MKNSTSILLTGLLATGCASLPAMKGNPWDRDVNYVIEEGKETEPFEGKSDFTVAIIPDKHSSYGCQASTYLTLEKLVLSGDVKFVAREGKVGPTEHESDAFQTKKYFDRNLQIQYYKDLIDLPLEQRQQQARSRVLNHNFPSQYWHNFFFDKPSRNWEEVMPMMASVLLESVYLNQVRTIGVENQKALDDAKTALYNASGPLYEAQHLNPPDKKKAEEAEKTFRAVENEHIRIRDGHMVINIQEYAGKIKEGHLIPLHVGNLHTQDLMQRFRDKMISYKVIEHAACMEAPTCTLTIQKEDIYQ